MWFKHRAWIPVAWLLSAVNIAAVWFAAQPGEPMHATLHALLATGFALGARRLMARHQIGGQDEMWKQAIDQSEYSQQTIEGVQSHVQELEERLEFAERLLAKHRDGERLDAPPSRPE